MNNSNLTKQILESLKDVDKKPNTSNTPSQDKTPVTPPERKPLNESSDGPNGRFSHNPEREKKVRYPYEKPEDNKDTKKKG